MLPLSSRGSLPFPETFLGSARYVQRKRDQETKFPADRQNQLFRLKEPSSNYSANVHRAYHWRHTEAACASTANQLNDAVPSQRTNNEFAYFTTRVYRKSMAFNKSATLRLTSSLNSCLRWIEHPAERISVPRRWRHKTKWAEYNATKKPIQQALSILDNMYGEGPYAKNWKSARLALLSTQKYCAVINNFSANSADMDAYMRGLGALPIEDYLREVRPRKASATSRRPIADSQSTNQSTNKETEELPEVDVSHYAITEKLRVLSGTPLTSASEPSENYEEDREFMPASRVMPVEDEDAPPVREHTVTPAERFPLLVDTDVPQVPTYLKAYIFPRGDISRFPEPKRDLSGFADYYLMDAASLLPVLALGLKHNDRVLDICAAPGGKSLAMLQTMLPGQLVCNDVSASRARRLDRVLKSFCPIDSPSMEGKVQTTVRDGTSFGWFEEGMFDKVLADVPCTVDRKSVNDEENNMFTSRRTGERNRLPQLQLEILMSACQNVLVGGTVVYSTCSLSPMQNDGVVHLAVEELKWEGVKMVVLDTSSFVDVFRSVYRFHFGEETPYGQTVLPHIANNFGPMYFAKLRRLA